MTFAVSVAAITIKLSVPASAPAAGDYQCRLLDSTGAELQKATNADPTFEFKGVAAEGSYVAEMSRLDVDGAVIPGSVISAPFSTPADAVPVPTTVDVNVPSVLTVTFVQE